MTIGITRRVLEQTRVSVDHENLVVLTVFENGVNKEQVKKTNEYSKRHYVLVDYNGEFSWK